MIGPLALHGGGEFLPGDEPFLRRLLALATERAGARWATEAAEEGDGATAGQRSGAGGMRSLPPSSASNS